jgi:polyhydroxybutyrate depolymerase
MTLRMACSASDTFAAFAEVGAALYTVMTDACRRGRPAPMLFMHGTADPSIPFDGVEVPDSRGGEPTRVTLSVQSTVAFFIRRNHCSLSGASTTFAEGGRSPGTHVIRFVPHDCDAGAPIVFYQINGGGHQWHGVPGVLAEETFGPVNMDINAGEVIWDFFSRQALPESR